MHMKVRNYNRSIKNVRSKMNIGDMPMCSYFKYGVLSADFLPDDMYSGI